MTTTPEALDDLTAVAEYFREILSSKKYVLLYAHNGTGKTRLSMTFKGLGRNGDERDTLYFNAFTEDLFYWDNDLDNDKQRELRLNRKSQFFEGLEELEMDTRIRKFLVRYASFDFKILNKNVLGSDGREKEITYVSFEKEELIDGRLKPAENIKVSRGEENIFVWCFFLAIARLAIDSETEDSAYSWVKYIYIDDPISSLDENNAITIASHLAQLLKKEDNKKKIVISTHHTLFFNVMCNELGRARKFILSHDNSTNSYNLLDMKNKDTPNFYHIAMLIELHKVAQGNSIYAYHFNILRSILEKTAVFHGLDNFKDCVKQDDSDTEGIIHSRRIDLLSHGNYSMFEPIEMVPENKQHFKNILKGFLRRYPFNPAFFPDEEINNY